MLVWTKSGEVNGCRLSETPAFDGGGGGGWNPLLALVPNVLGGTAWCDLPFCPVMLWLGTAKKPKDSSD